MDPCCSRTLSSSSSTSSSILNHESYLAAFNEIQAKKELMQQRHYFLLNEMQSMAKELPPKYQQRLPNELLSDITNALLDGTVYEIVSGLKEIQTMTEKTLFSQRMKIVNAQKFEMQDMHKKHKEMMQENKGLNSNGTRLLQSTLQQQLNALKKRQKEETNRMDMKLILELDQKVSDQQVTLEKAGVPGFFVTNNPVEIRLQMYLLEFVQRLSTVQLPV